ncbi:TPA: hypothetical protein QH551_005231 [Klebsiella pneumoniae subsp. ozaenae]|nr:hypothetical protein [Escherichia coli]HBV2092758.1 hypothetical protein [Klebsiella quasipneumoniae]HBZ4113021.1 hypothetical protein [Klebsiella pneumoniae]HCU0694949.1 hypothetical protein [Enterobacter hormaechei]HDS7618309.1 hypothetical protein [Klebsiella pneumoniae subsp. ozaenae]HDS7751179.1 hypothetical protein [Klebsiella pneumoniae subsp. pneumoniae]
MWLKNVLFFDGHACMTI